MTWDPPAMARRRAWRGRAPRRCADRKPLDWLQRLRQWERTKGAATDWKRVALAVAMVGSRSVSSSGQTRRAQGKWRSCEGRSKRLAGASIDWRSAQPIGGVRCCTEGNQDRRRGRRGSEQKTIRSIEGGKRDRGQLM